MDDFALLLSPSVLSLSCFISPSLFFGVLALSPPPPVFLHEPQRRDVGGGKKTGEGAGEEGEGERWEEGESK